MGKIGLLAAALLGLSMCCRQIRGSSLEDVAQAKVPPNAIDCGAFVAPFAESNGQWTGGDAGAFEAGVSCILGAEDAGEPFVMLLTRTGADFEAHYAYFAGTDGVAWVLWQYHEPDSPAEMGPCVNDVDGATCTPGLTAGVFPADLGDDDGGLRGLDCPDAGTTVLVSPGDPQCAL